ncbi:hypothetical protein E3P86_03177 [Wallemia ichthyophaga]|uniref:BZIP domain-containing protein n=1 Tax=Wallemia ichthyophaga TaxID=245174 RepID=A0A4T0IXR0_WALIC|nr:hypothetical protein E3P86_03177 [Wallemia ichthyophaga]
MQPIKDEVNVFEESWKEHNMNNFNQLYPHQVDLQATPHTYNSNISHNTPETIIPQTQPNATQSLTLLQAATQSQPSSYTDSASSERSSPTKKSRRTSHNLDNNEIPPLMKPVGRRGDISLQFDEDGRELSREERRKITMERNKSAAARCRQRKRQWTLNLQEEVDMLYTEQQALKDERQLLKNEIDDLRKTMEEVVSTGEPNTDGDIYRNGDIYFGAYNEYNDKNPKSWYGTLAGFEGEEINVDNFRATEKFGFPALNFNFLNVDDKSHPSAETSNTAIASSEMKKAVSNTAVIPKRFDLAVSPTTASKPWQKIPDAPPLMKPVGRAGDKSLRINADGVKLSTEERKSLVLERNRSAALRSRTRKKLWLTELETKVETLTAEQDELKSERSALQEKIFKLKEEIIELKEELLRSRGQF